MNNILQEQTYNTNPLTQYEDNSMNNLSAKQTYNTNSSTQHKNNPLSCDTAVNITAANDNQFAYQQGFPLIHVRQLLQEPAKTNWLVEGFFVANELAMIFGPAESAKSLIALDLSFCISTGINWCDAETQTGPVVYICGEGNQGIAKRIKAIEKKYNVRADNLYISKISANLTDEENAKLVYESIKNIGQAPVLIIIDTLHRNTASDENSSKDFALFLTYVDKYLRTLGAAVIIVHHTGHGDQSRARGSSSMRAALDSEYSKLTAI